MRKDRDLSFDAFRGLAIIAVIAIHAYELTMQKPFSDGKCDLFIVMYRQLLNFAVPAFIFISGYWASQKTIESLGDYKEFLTKRFLRVLVPYLLWSFVFIAYKAVRSGDVSIYQIAATLLTGKAPGSHYYWFFVVIIQLYIVTPAMQYLNKNKFGIILIFTLNGIALLSRYISRLYLNVWIPSTGLFCSWLIFYQIGLWAGAGGNIMLKPRGFYFYILPAILASLLVSSIEAIVILSRSTDLYLADSPLKLSSFLYAIFVILGFLCIKGFFDRLPKLLCSIGRYSLGIYLIHIIILRQTISFLRKMDAVASFQPLHQFVLVATTTVICLLIICSARKLLPECFCSKILGFGDGGKRVGYVYKLSEKGGCAEVGVDCGNEET